jgi:hypothetical protein
VLHEISPSLTKDAVFASDRRADVSVEINAPIPEGLGDEATAIADYLIKAGAALLQPYPANSIQFCISRVIADADHVIRQDVRTSEAYVGPTLEVGLKNVMTSAANWIQAFDPMAFITASVTEKHNHVTPVRHKQDRIRWWRCDD